MAGLVPGPVSRGFRRGLDTGSLSGSVLVFDISGFTPLTEELSRMGHHGAEELAEILQRVFSPGVLRLIRSAGGFVSGFSGDSFTVIFPGTEFLESLKTADKILNKLRASSADNGGASSIYHGGASSAGTGSGRFPPLEFKAGAASGDIRWHILGRDSRGWLFSGPAVSSASAAVNGASSMEVCRGLADPVTCSDTRAPVIRSSRKTEAAFFPPVILSAARSGEFRRVFSVFVSLGTEEDEKRLRDRAALMMDHCFEAGGYWNGVHHDAAGPYALALFGAPWSYENDGTRSLVFSRRLMEEFGEELHIGLDAGTVYAGMVGFNRRATYTVLGNSVNTASRIMRCSSRPGIRISGAVHERVSGNTFGAELLEIPLKGRSGLTEVYSIQPEYFSETGGRFQQIYVGRLREKERFRRTSMKVL